MRIGRTLPSAAAPISLGDILSGLADLCAGEKETARFQQELAVYHQVSHCFLLSSGKAALTVTLLALKRLYPERDEVLIPAYTCYSVPAAIVRAGLKIRVCDQDPETLDFDFAALERQLAASSRLLCVVPTHLFGIIVDLKRLKSMLGSNGPIILEDAAQAMGEETPDGRAGTLGDVGILSLGRGKVLSAVSGGVILTDNREIGQAVRHIIDGLPAYSFLSSLTLVGYAVVLWLFMRPWLFWLPKALPFLGLGETHFDPDFPLRRFTPFQASLARRWQRLLPDFQQTRRMNVGRYLSAGLDCPATLRRQLRGHIRFPAYVTAEARSTILVRADAAGLGLSCMYPTTVTGIPGIAGHLVGGTAAGAERVATRIVSLPVHPWVREKDIDQIVSLLNEYRENVSGDGKR